MLNSLFILNTAGVVIIEKHYCGTTSRSVCESFWEEVRKHPRPEDVPPILPTAKFYLFSIFRNGLFFLANVALEAPPLYVLEFLHRIFDVFVIYFDHVDEAVIKRNFATVYQLLEELADNGIAMITEPNALNSLIEPPSVGRRVLEFVTGKSRVSETIGAAAMSVIPWRKADVKHIQNEVYFDLFEDIDCVIDPNGAVVRNDIRGVIQCKCNMSGTPDLAMFFTDTKVLDDVSFHPCVRFSAFDRDRVVSFVPPDGDFKLMEYRVPEMTHNAPLYLRPQVRLENGKGTFSFTLGSKPMAVRRSTFEGGAAAAPESAIEDIKVVIQVPPNTTGIEWTANHGTVGFDVKIHELTWIVGRYPRDKTPQLNGSIGLAGKTADAAPAVAAGDSSSTSLGTSSAPPSAKPAVVQSVLGCGAELSFVMPNTTASGLGVREVKLMGETYKFYKGVRTFLRSGRFVVRY